MPILLPKIKLISNSLTFRSNIAIQHSARPDVFTYDDLLIHADTMRKQILSACANSRDIAEARVAYMFSPGFEYVATTWAVWMAGGIAVPLHIGHPKPEIEYIVKVCVFFHCEPNLAF